MGIFLAFVLLCLAALGGRLFTVQITQSAMWQNKARIQSSRTTNIVAARGNIYSRDGVPLALDVPSDTIAVDPEQVADPTLVAQQLQPVLGLDVATLETAMRRETYVEGGRSRQRRWRLIAAGVDANVASTVASMGLPGITVEASSKRAHPADALAGSLLGVVTPGFGVQPIGGSGIELQYNGILAGRPGKLIDDRTGSGIEIPRSQQVDIAARAGQSIVLTLDEAIQYDAEQTLLRQVQAQSATGGTAVVMDLRNGDVLAMASVTRAADPSAVARVAPPGALNQAIGLGYSPGSVMKIVTISKALDKGCITPTTTFQVPDHMQNGNFPLRDDEVHGIETWTARDILTHSSNVGTAMIARLCFTPSELDGALRAYGFGRATPLGFTGEISGALLSPDRYYTTGLASNAIGYSLMATPMQILDAYATVARGGQSIDPRLVRETIDPSGTHHELASHVGARVVAPWTAAAMRGFFANVVRAGTGTCAAIPGFEVAGKTGTVRKSGAHGYGGGYYASFVGFAPATAPRLAAIVVLDNPGSQYGGKAAAPVFAQIMTTALARMQVTSPADDTGAATQYSDAKPLRSAACNVPLPQPTVPSSVNAVDQNGESPLPTAAPSVAAHTTAAPGVARPGG